MKPVSLNPNTLLHPVVLLGAGCALGAAATFAYFGAVALLALVPFFILIHQGYPARTVAYKAFIFGIGYVFVSYSWVVAAYPLTWIGIESPLISIALLGIAAIVSATVVSLTVSARALVMRALIRTRTFPFPLLALSSVWVLFEYVGAFAFSLVWAGAEGVVGAHWTFGFLGYALAEVPVVRSLAAFGGIYLLSFLVVLGAGLVYSALQTEKSHRFRDTKTAGAVLVLMLIIAGIMYSLAVSREPVETQTAVALHTTYPAAAARVSDEENTLRAARMVAKLGEVIELGVRPDIVAFPESSAVTDRLPPSLRDALFQTLGQNGNVLILNPSIRFDAAGNRLSAVVYEDTAGTTYEQRKTFLAPVGEYAPYIMTVPAALLGEEVVQAIDDIYAYRGYVRAPLDGHPDTDVGMLQCSEIVSPTFYRLLAQHHGVLANAASHAAFSRALLIREPTLKMARIHAVSNDRFFIQSGNVAPAFIIDNTGAVRGSVVGKQTAVVVGEVDVRYTKTAYTQFGDWFLLAALIVMVGAALPFIGRRFV